MIDDEIYEGEMQEDEEKIRRLKIIYLIILIILLIFTCIVSFKTGEGVYFLLNTNNEIEKSQSDTGIASWNFDARIEIKE